MHVVEGSLHVRGPVEEEPFFGRVLGVQEPVLGALPVHLVGIGIGSRAADERYRDLLEILLALLHKLGVVVGVDERPEGHALTLPLLREDVPQVGVHPVVGVVHGPFPLRLVLGREGSRLSAGLVDAIEHAQQVGHHLEYAARMELTDAPHAAVAAHGVVGVDGLEGWMPLHRRPELLAPERGDADHSHVPVAPRLLSDPLDHVVVVGPVVRVVVAFGLPTPRSSAITCAYPLATSRLVSPPSTTPYQREAYAG